MSGTGRTEWTVVRTVRTFWQRIRRQWAARPLEARRRWWGTMAAGYALTVAVTAVLTGIGRALEREGYLAWEAAVLERVAAISFLSFNTATWMEIPANSVMLWPLLVLIAGGLVQAGRAVVAVSLLVGFALIDPLVFAGWALWSRDRPTMIQGGLADPGAFFNAFPSGHAAQAVFAYGFLTVLWIRASPSRGERMFAVCLAVALILLVAVARLRVGAHWPSDIVAGWIVGGVWLVGVLMAMRRVNESMD